MSDKNAKRSWKVFETMYYKLFHYSNLLLRHGERNGYRRDKGKVIKIIDSTPLSAYV
ncbi:MAG: hypothetical protein M9959_05795 [Chitinophagaceae bacterium]|nr:hypothetical protein [Chitinophagaceae bacterium]